MMIKELESKFRVRFQDCDPFNHLNNSKYLDYFINAREDQIEEHYGLDMMEHIQTHGNGWVVGSSQLMYMKPAETMETVLIKTRLVQHTDKALLMEGMMFDEAGKVLKSVAWVRFVYFSLREKRSTTHSEELMELFRAVTIPVEDQLFELRCKSIAREARAVVGS